MRAPRTVVSILITTALTPLQAQTSAPDASTTAQMALACTAVPTRPATTTVRILGAQDTLPHTLLTPHDLLIIGAGTDAGLHPGQEFFIRHSPYAARAPYGRSAASRMDPVAARYSRGPSMSTTAGWLRIVSVNRTTAIATVEHACDAIFQNDYLEPFEMPVLPPTSAADDGSGDLDFTSPARIVAAPEEHLTAAAGEFVVIDRGRNQRIEPGARLAIYRDMSPVGMPLTPLGQALVMSASPDTSLVRIDRARDAVLVGDYLVPRR